MRLAKAVFLGLIILVGSITTGGVSLAKSPKFVESDITSDTRWTRSEGPFRIIEPIKVKNNVTLIIEAGTRVEFASGAKLVVKGNLTAGQNGDRRVIFTSSKPSPKPGAWGGIELFGPTEIAQNPSGFVNGTVNFDGVSIRYATTGLEVWKTGTAILTNVRISNVSESGIAVTRRGELRIHNSIINKGITPGIVFGGVNPRYLKISSSIVNGDITFTGGMRPKYIHILNSKINGSISVESDFFEPFKSNPKPPILLVNNTVDGSVSIDYFLNAKVSRNRIHGHLGLNVRSASILKNHLIGRSSKTGIGVNVRESAQIMNNEIHQFKYGIHIGGEVIDISIINNHIYNNSYGIHLPAIRIGNNTITDNSIVSNTKAGILLGPDHRSTWYLKGKQVEITSNIISFNRRGIVVREVGYTTIFAKRNTITHNKRVGILIKQNANSPGHKFTKSLIENNSIGFKAATNTKAVIKKNYWGAASGPHHPSINPSGKGNNVTGKLSNVNLIPFAKTRIDEAPIPPIVDLQWNAPQITLSTKNDVTVSKYILWVEDVHRHSTTRSQLKLDLSSGRHTISVFGINKRGFEGPLHKETITIRTPTPSPTPSPTPPPTRTSSVTPSKAEQTTTAGKSTRQSTTTRRDSDGDGVPDTEDYAPRDPNVQKRSDIQDRGDGRSIVQPGFGVRVTILALLGILILAWWHRTGDE